MVVQNEREDHKNNKNVHLKIELEINYIGQNDEIHDLIL